MENEKLERMRELVRTLNKASRAYYQDGNEIMPNIEYDRLYDELSLLEKETGTILSASPTIHVGYEVLSELPKERHPSPMLSLNKTKSISELQQFLGERSGVLSWKMDGLTVVLTYENGELVKAVTRGNGEIGEVITENARCFENIPTRISFRGRLVLRGEAIIPYSVFNAINGSLSDADAKYKNPRNLCAGSVRQLDPSVTKSRHVHFLAFTLVSAVEEDGAEPDYKDSMSARYDFMSSLGFEVVEHWLVTNETLPAAVKHCADVISDNDFPSDGLVLFYEDYAYGESLGRTAKYPRNGIAYKWTDETEETVLRKVEWSPSRTGLINPVAVFDPVELEGTTVSRASLHNVSFCEDLGLGIGDRITVYKANMIIPQIAENLTRSGTLRPAEHCPACGTETVIRDDSGSRFLVCPNPECPAKKLKNFAHFVSRDALNIDGLSDATLEKLIGRGMIRTYDDIFHLSRYASEIMLMDGFGEKSTRNLLEAVKNASNTDLYRLIYGLGIGGIGLANARMLCRYFGDDLGRLRAAETETLLQIDGIGPVLAESLARYFHDPEKRAELDRLLSDLTFRRSAEPERTGGVLEGKSVVITGKLQHFSNRRDLQELIEKAGGRASGSVSARTAYLVNNDASSSSTKNQKAHELGIPVVTEEEFLEILNGGADPESADKVEQK